MSKPWAVMLVLWAATAGAYDVAAVKGGGSIAGGVRFEGTAPTLQKIAIEKDPGVCGTGERAVGEVAVDPKGNLKGAVVYLEKIAAGKAWPETAEGSLIEQEGCRFLPKTLVMRKGSAVTIKNKDKVFHNIHAYELAGASRISMFNDGQPAASELQHDLRMRKSNEVKLECDAHKFMHEWFLVLDHPYFGSTAADGKYTISEVPPGSYQLVAWHPVLGRQSAPVEVKAGGTASADFTFKK